MGNCLKQQLKAIVNNSSLPKFGYIGFKMRLYESMVGTYFNNDLTDNSQFHLGGEDCSVEIIGNNNVLFNNGSNKAESTFGQNIYIPDTYIGEEFILRVSNMYEIRHLAFQHVEMKIELSDFKYLTKLSVFYAYIKGDSKISGKLSDLSGSFTYLRFNSAYSDDVIGTLDEYAALIAPVHERGSYYTGQALNGTRVHGDLAKVPSDYTYFNIGSSTATSTLLNTWTPGIRDNENCNVLCIGGNECAYMASVEDVNNFFIDNAKCTYSDPGSGMRIMWLYINGTYTPSAEAITAINALYNKGIESIKVNNIELDNL